MSKISKTEFKLPTTRSALSFLFLPEFKRAFPAFDHIGPIFVRTIALMFSQSGLLRPNHPATMYGMVKNGPKFKVADLFGEAWFNLRVGDGSTPYHYGLFFGVILMICTTIVGFFLFVINLALSMAQAQIFDHPTLGTDWADVPAAGAGIMYDTQQGSQDLAISVLDRVLRQPALGQGGSLQDALGPLMNTYNTAVLMLAAILVFWGIISILLDTARTGQLGGGRHSMVWIPVRFIFSMGLLIPLGSGFNSGQMIVMKVAEWGSNLGTNGWVAYVASVMDDSLIPPITIQDQSSVALDYARILACRAAVNMSYDHSNGGNAIDPDLQVRFYVRGGDPNGVVQLNNAAFAYANNQVVNLDKVFVGNKYIPNYCGEIHILNPDYEELDALVVAPPAGALEPTNTFRAVSREIRTGHRNALFAMHPAGKNLACSLSMDYQQNFGGTTNCAGANGDGPYATAPGSNDTFGDDVVPNSTSIDTMMLAYYDPSAAAGPLQDALANASGFISNYITAGPFMDQIRNRGWGGMGLWYHKITTMSDNLAQINGTWPTFRNGRLEKLVSQETILGLFRSGKTKEAKKKAKEMLSNFDKWWASAQVNSAPTTASGRLVADNFTNDAGGANIARGQGAVMRALGWVLSPKDVIFNFEGSGGTAYPMSALAGFADTLLAIALTGYGVIALADGVANADAGILNMVPNPGKAVASAMSGIMSGQVGEFVGTILGMMMLGAMVLKYYIPLLPWIRVTFSVLSWIVSIFEFVVIMPVLCLANLNTQGEGLFTQGARNMWVGALNILLRPVLTVIGFVGAILIFNAILLYVNDTFNETQRAIAAKSATGPIDAIVFSFIYVIIVYMLATTTYKLIDSVPGLVMKWMGGPQDDAYQDSALEGFIVAGARVGQGAGTGLMKGATRKTTKAKQAGNQQPPSKKDGGGPGASG